MIKISLIIFFILSLPLQPLFAVEDQIQIKQVVTGAVCGNGICESEEDYISCPADCPAPAPTPPAVQGGGPLIDTTIPGIQYLAVTTTHNSAIVFFRTNESATAVLSWGKTLEYELGSIAEIDFGIEHSVLIPDLEPETNYSFKIELRDEARNLNKIENQKFTTLVLPDLIPPANVSNFEISVVDGAALKLDWQNPIDPDFNRVRIVKSTKFFPMNINDGETIFEGKGETLLDKNILRGTRYYYTIFAFDASGNYSSGAVASGIIAVPGIVPPPEFPPELPSELVPAEIEKITITDFNFFQKGKRLAVVEEKIQVVSEEPLEIKLDYKKVPEVLKTILVTLAEPEENGKTFSFLLKVNKEKTDYEAILAPLKKSGIYGVTVSILDFKNQTLKKIKTALLVSGLEAAVTETVPFWKKLPFPHTYIYIIVAALILLLLAIVLIRGKKKEYAA